MLLICILLRMLKAPLDAVLDDALDGVTYSASAALLMAMTSVVLLVPMPHSYSPWVMLACVYCLFYPVLLPI
ncbi:hypothetical protein U1Q18_004227 [Sarracenia purpurea var. burkii]